MAFKRGLFAMYLGFKQGFNVYFGFICGVNGFQWGLNGFLCLYFDKPHTDSFVLYN